MGFYSQFVIHLTWLVDNRLVTLPLAAFGEHFHNNQRSTHIFITRTLGKQRFKANLTLAQALKTKTNHPLSLLTHRERVRTCVKPKVKSSERDSRCSDCPMQANRRKSIRIRSKSCVQKGIIFYTTYPAPVTLFRCYRRLASGSAIHTTIAQQKKIVYRALKSVCRPSLLLSTVLIQSKWTFSIFHQQSRTFSIDFARKVFGIVIKCTLPKQLLQTLVFW